MMSKNDTQENAKGIPVNSSHCVLLSILLLWFLVFLPQPHKEERFLFPVFPVICVTAALSLDIINQFTCKLCDSFGFCRKLRLSMVCLNLTLVFLLAVGLVSMSRGITLYKGYHAPLDVYTKIEGLHDRIVSWETKHQTFLGNLSICVGKEWHRYPSSFFLPHDRWRLNFLKSSFGGQLPADFDEVLQGIVNRTRAIPRFMNDQNREEMSRYVPVNQCHFVIDTDYKDFSKDDVPYSKMQDFSILYSQSFMDSVKTEFPWRSFFIPYVTEKKWVMINYNVLRHVNNTLNFPEELFIGLN